MFAIGPHEQHQHPTTKKKDFKLPRSKLEFNPPKFPLIVSTETTFCVLILFNFSDKLEQGGGGEEDDNGGGVFQERRLGRQSMANHCCVHFAFSPSPNRDFKPSSSSVPPAFVMFSDKGPSYNTLVFQAVRLLGPPARFEASKLKVEVKGDETNRYTRIVPRTYTLSHCDFTANLTLTISRLIHLDQLKGWYNKDDVVAQWTEVKGDVCLDVHCYVSGPNSFLELAAEFRYHIFSKELPLVLQAMLHGDSSFFSKHQELMTAPVRVYFHSSSKKYNRVESWGPLKDAAQGRTDDQHSLLAAKESPHYHKNWGSPKSLFQALVAFLL